MTDGRDRDVALYPKPRDSKTCRVRDPALFRRVKKLLYDFCVSRGFPKKKDISDVEALHSALVLCEKHLDPAQSALVMKREILQDAVDRHLEELVEAEIAAFIRSVVPSLSAWLGVKLSIRKESGNKYFISHVGASIPRPAIPDGAELEISPPEIMSPALDINNLILGMN